MQEPKHRLYIPVSGDQQQFPLTQHAAKTQGHWEEPEQHSALELQVSLHTPSISTVLDSCFRNHQIGLGSPYSLQNPQSKQETSEMDVPNLSAQNVPCPFFASAPHSPGAADWRQGGNVPLPSLMLLAQSLITSTQ